MRSDIRRVRRKRTSSPRPSVRPRVVAPRPVVAARPPAAEPPIRSVPPTAFDRPDPPRSGIRPKSVVVAVAVLLAVAVIGLRAQGSAAEAKGEVADRVQVARQALGAAQEQLKAADLAGAEHQFEVAEQSFSQANQLLADQGLVGGMAAGQGSGDIRTGQQMLAAGESTARSGRRLLGEVRAVGEQTANSDQGFYRAGEALSQRLPNMEKDLAELDRNLKLLGFLQQRAARSNNPELLAASKEFAALLPESRAAVAQAKRVADALPTLLGHDQFSRYLLLFQNPAELRPTGGFTGTYGRLTLNDGRMTEFTIDSIYSPANQANVAVKEDAPEPVKRLASGAGVDNPRWLMQDANWNPDFPESARKYQWFYGKSGGPSTDGVIAVTATPVVEILRVVGPIEQPDGRPPVTADAFMSEVADYQRTQASTGNDPKALLRDFAPKLLEKIRQAPPEQQRQVRKILAAAVTAKDIQLYFTDERLERLAGQAGLSGRLLNRPNQVAIVDANLTATKSSRDITSTVTRTMTIDDSGRQHANLSIVRRHSGATSSDRNGNYTRIYLPKGSTVDNLDGWSDYAPPNVSTEGDFAVVGGWSDVEPGEERDVQVAYQSPETVDLRRGTLPVSFWRQAGSKVRLVTEVTLPSGYVWDGQPGATVTGNVIRFEQPVASDIVHQLSFRPRP